MPRLVDRLTSRLSGSSERHDRQEIQEQCHRSGSTPVAEVHDREMAQCTGTVRTVSLRPRTEKTPALVVDLDDGTRTLTVVFLGRRQIAGIDPGVMLTVRGRVCMRRETPTIYNPAYDIVPTGKG
ncbi:OB-fold nucleic acid binding domain-containing protein [Calidifontibacter terrae]